MKKEVLDNGVRILTKTQSYATAATLAVFVGVGSRHESPDENGLAHFIEHAVFKGTTTRTAVQIANETDMIGGQNNAYTTKEFTCFYIRVLPEFDTIGLELISDLVLNPVFNQADIDIERSVILEEIAMYEDDSEDLAADGIYKACWLPNQIGASIAGTKQTVKSFGRDEVLRFFRRHYRPENIVVTASGKFDVDAVTQKAKALFGGLETGYIPPVITAPGWNDGQSLSYHRHNEQLQFSLAFPCPGVENGELRPLGLLNSIIGGSGSSRLFQRLREELGLAYSLFSYITAHKGCGAFIVAGGISPEVNERVMQEIRSEFDKLSKEGVTETELLRAKNQMRAALAMSYENTYNEAMEMGRREILGLTHRTHQQNMQLIENITLEQVNELAARMFDFDKMCSCFAGETGK